MKTDNDEPKEEPIPVLPGQMDLGIWPEKPDDKPKGHARNSDPQTSHDAVPTTERISELERKVVDLLRRALPRGLTSLECCDLLHIHPWSISPRFRELQRRGLIIESGLKRNPKTGKNMIVWRAVRPV